jgi:glycosyltransferase 2 family protein
MNWTPVIQFLKNWGGRILAAGLMIWVIRLAVAQWQSVPRLGRIEWLPLACGILFVALGQFQVIRSWRAVLGWLGAAVSWRAVFSIFSMSALGRYLPGKVLVVVGKVALLEQLGIERKTALGSVIWEMGLILTAAGLFWVPVSTQTLQGRFPLEGIGFAAIVLLIGLFCAISFQNGLRKGLGLLVLIGNYMLFWLLLGTGFYLVSRSLMPLPVDQLVWNIIQGYALVHVLSVAVIFVPGGLGIRELGLQWVFQGTVLGPITGIVALLMRAIIITFELIFAGLGLSMKQTNLTQKIPQKTAS